MKTAMQELMQWMEESEFMVNKAFIEKVNECLKKEKKQIIDAFVECWKANMPDGYECKLSAKEYYNKTYNQNK